MPLSQQLDDLGRALRKIGPEHFVAPIQQEELVEFLRFDLADGVSRAAVTARELEAKAPKEAVR